MYRVCMPWVVAASAVSLLCLFCIFQTFLIIYLYVYQQKVALFFSFQGMFTIVCAVLFVCEMYYWTQFHESEIHHFECHRYSVLAVRYTDVFGSAKACTMLQLAIAVTGNTYMYRP